jgi:hypothetical protein
MPTVKSTRAPRAHSRSRRTRDTHQPDLDAALGHLSDAISIIATAANAFLGAEERAGTTHGGDEIVTLGHGVCCLRRAYDELDVAIRLVRRQ